MFDDDGYRFLRAALDEIAPALGLGLEYELIRVAASRESPENQQVFRLSAGTQDLCLKMDRNGAKSGRLRDEFANLQALHGALGEAGAEAGVADRTRVPTPRYLNADATVLASDFVDAPSAFDLAQDPHITPEARAGICAQAGRCLTGIHCAWMAKSTPLGLGWVLKRMAKLSEDKSRMATGPRSRALADHMTTASIPLRNRPVAQVWSHGDFRTTNILMPVSASNAPVAIDLSHMRYKVDAYDIVDFLCDFDLLADADPAQISPMGISNQALEAFMRGYQRRVDMKVLTFSMRARLLIHWLRITRSQYEQSAEMRRRFHEHEKRLNVVFADVA